MFSFLYQSTWAPCCTAPRTCHAMHHYSRLISPTCMHSAANPPHATAAWWDRQVDGPCSALSSAVFNTGTFNGTSDLRSVCLVSFWTAEQKTTDIFHYLWQVNQLYHHCCKAALSSRGAAAKDNRYLRLSVTSQQTISPCWTSYSLQLRMWT